LIIEAARAAGLTVIAVAHTYPKEALQVADRVSAMYLGRIAADLPNDDTMTRESLVQLITSGRAGDIGLTEGISE